MGLEISLRAKAGGTLVALVADTHVLRLHVLLQDVEIVEIQIIENLKKMGLMGYGIKE